MTAQSQHRPTPVRAPWTRVLAALALAAGVLAMSVPGSATSASASASAAGGSRAGATGVRSAAPGFPHGVAGLVPHPVCAAVQSALGRHCFAQRLGPPTTPAEQRFATRNASDPPLTPSDLASAYNLDTTAGAGQTVAVLEAYRDFNIDSDLAQYRANFGLPPCTEASGCLREVDQNGGGTLPGTDDPGDPTGNDIETMLDLEAVSAVCPNCRLIVVEANTLTSRDLDTGLKTATTLAGNVSVSIGGGEAGNQSEADLDAYLAGRTGVAVTVAAGDCGYGSSYPAASPYVTAVGGTALTRSATTRGWTETVWNGGSPQPITRCGGYAPTAPGSAGLDATGSACTGKPRPSYQPVLAGCANRVMNDISAAGDPAHGGLDVYFTDSANGTHNWAAIGGTSESAPIVAGIYALSGGEGNAVGPAPLYRTQPFNDVTVGSNVNSADDCGTARYALCHAQVGFDGPTGMGTPNGIFLTLPPGPVSNLAASSSSPGQLTATWSPPSPGAALVTGYTVNTFDALGHFVSTQPASASPATVTGLTNGQPYYVTVAAVNAVGTGTATSSNSVTPSAGTVPPARLTAVSTAQYVLPNSDGTLWQDLDATNLSLSITPGVTEDVLLSANADLWTWDATFNQDIGICVAAGTGPCTILAWKESGGFAGTFSPNAAFVQAVMTMTAGTQYSVRVQWKANRSAIGTRISAAAGPNGGPYSPSRLTARPLAPYEQAQSAVSTQQYNLNGSDGTTWQDVDPAGLKVTITPNSDETLLLSANADAWTWNAGFNQDLAIVVTPSGGPRTVAGWKESGGFAGTFSPNAAFIEALYPVTHGVQYTVTLAWKTNRPAQGTRITIGAGPSTPFSPTRLTAVGLPTAENAASVVSTAQYTLPDSDGTTWQTMDPSNLTLQYAATSTAPLLVALNSDLWTSSAGINQDMAVFMTDVTAGTAPQLVAWKESGGFAGTYSPNAAFLESVVAVTNGHTYTFTVEWKSNRPATGASIWAAAGPIAGLYSPTRLSVLPQLPPA